MIGPLDLQVPQQIRENPVFWMGVAGPGRLIDRLQPHQAHQTVNPVTADANAFAPQMADYLAAAVEIRRISARFSGLSPFGV